MKYEDLIGLTIVAVIFTFAISIIFFSERNIKNNRIITLVINIILILLILFCGFLMVLSRIYEWNYGMEIICFIIFTFMISKLLCESLIISNEIKDKMR